mmetsp:Transcript_29397/g.49812  ORF Transcript_29397/g.49812 Transcript_29397/m.49812 type:complete len:159 (+) Transcript_29397:182-658(+)
MFCLGVFVFSREFGELFVGSKNFEGLEDCVRVRSCELKASWCVLLCEHQVSLISVEFPCLLCASNHASFIFMNLEMKSGVIDLTDSEVKGQSTHIPSRGAIRNHRKSFSIPAEMDEVALCSHFDTWNFFISFLSSSQSDHTTSRHRCLARSHVWMCRA